MSQKKRGRICDWLFRVRRTNRGPVGRAAGGALRAVAEARLLWHECAGWLAEFFARLGRRWSPEPEPLPLRVQQQQKEHSRSAAMHAMYNAAAARAAAATVAEREKARADREALARRNSIRFVTRMEDADTPPDSESDTTSQRLRER